AELGQVTARLLPLAAAARRELEAQADQGPDLQPLAEFQQQAQLEQGFEHDEHFLADLLTHQREFQVGLVLDPVADNGRLGRTREREGDGELSLAADLDAEAVAVAEVQYFLHHVFLLVHLDGVDGHILAPVAELLDRRLERAGQFLNLVIEDLREAQDHRGGYPALAQLVDDALQGHRGPAGGLERQDHFAGAVDVEVLSAPVADPVQVDRFFQGVVRGGGTYLAVAPSPLG